MKKIWIDLDNSPHVPFFKPIIEELSRRGYELMLTARDAFQVLELAGLLNLKCKPIGRHYGRNMFLKVAGLVIRAMEMAPSVLRERPVFALSHGSRSQLLLAWALRIPCCILGDYEHTRDLIFIKPTWVIMPEIIPSNAINLPIERIRKYQGIKEDVYVPNFEPDPGILPLLGLSQKDLVVTIRPPATEAYYHNPESEKLFSAVIEFLGQRPDVRMVILPRNEKKQTAWVKKMWPEWCASEKIIFPHHVVNGLNLIWYSDFVVSGGGTMNREAAALEVPVYSIFRGKIGAVDRYLADNGRLTILRSVDDVRKKIRIVRRNHSDEHLHTDKTTLKKIVNEVTALVG